MAANLSWGAFGKATDLRSRILFTIGLLIVYRLGTYIPVPGIDAVVHLAAAVSGDCERDLDLGLRSNLDTTRALLQAARAAGHAPLFVYASSVAVFGGVPGQPMPDVITDDTLPAPQGSYGIQKFVGEQLVADFGRRGLVQARNVRVGQHLGTQAVHDGAARKIGAVQNARGRVPALACEVECAVLVAVKRNLGAVDQHFVNAYRPLGAQKVDGLVVVVIVPGNQNVLFQRQRV